MAARAWRAARDAGRGTEGGWRGEPWCHVWALFTSACFGVVLEGPMGAVVFWILLGVAAARSPVSETAADGGGAALK